MQNGSDLTAVPEKHYNSFSAEFSEAVADLVLKRLKLPGLGKWPTVNEIVAQKYCPYGKKKLIALIKKGIIEGGQLDDKNETWFVNRSSLDQHMQSLLRRVTDVKYIDSILEAL